MLEILNKLNTGNLPNKIMITKLKLKGIKKLLYVGHDTFKTVHRPYKVVRGYKERPLNPAQQGVARLNELTKILKVKKQWEQSIHLVYLKNISRFRLPTYLYLCRHSLGEG